MNKKLKKEGNYKVEQKFVSPASTRGLISRHDSRCDNEPSPYDQIYTLHSIDLQ